MEQRIKLVASSDDKIDNSRIIQEWMVEENNRMREANVLKTAKDVGERSGMRKGLKQGKKQGIEIGKEEGIQIGREEGKKQGIELNKIEMIKNMLTKNTDYNFISEITGKTIDEIKEIEKNM